MKHETSEPQKAYNYAIYLLSLKLRTEGEIREKMSIGAVSGSAGRSKGYPPAIINDIVGQLVANKYLDDQSYAEVYLDNLKKYKLFGFYGIKKKLMEKRLPSNIIESVLKEGLSIEEETKIAKRLIKKLEKGDKSRSSGSGVRARLVQRLKSRGFREEIVAKLVF